jgi:Isochorismatase family
VIVCGIRTEQCCETTARVASDLGYGVTFVTDATATSPIEHRDAPAGRSVEEILADPRTLPVDDIITRTEYALAGRFATIATVAELAGAAVAAGG